MCTLALRFEVEHLPIGIVDQDRSVASRKLAELFTLTEAFDLARRSQSPAEAQAWLQAGDVALVLVIPTGFEQYYQAGIDPAVQLLLDGTNSNTPTRSWGGLRPSGGRSPFAPWPRQACR